MHWLKYIYVFECTIYIMFIIDVGAIINFVICASCINVEKNA